MWRPPINEKPLRPAVNLKPQTPQFSPVKKPRLRVHQHLAATQGGTGLRSGSVLSAGATDGYFSASSNRVFRSGLKSMTDDPVPHSLSLTGELADRGFLHSLLGLQAKHQHGEHCTALRCTPTTKARSSTTPMMYECKPEIGPTRSSGNSAEPTWRVSLKRSCRERHRHRRCWRKNPNRRKQL